MLNLVKRFDKWLDTHIPLLLLLTLLLVLRIPNLFEPYWYGDEGIYLTIGNALKDGQRLYADIIDHKTPIIYYLAMMPNQRIFRLLNIFWMLLTTIFFHHLAKKLIKPKKYAVIASLIFILFTTLPRLEGNIPNGELFVMGFIMLGSFLLTKTKLFANFFVKKTNTEKISLDNIKTDKFTAKNILLLFSAGVSFGLGVLTKVPGLFDALAFLTPSWFLLTNTLTFSPQKNKSWAKLAGKVIGENLVIMAGLITSVIGSILYFMARGTFDSYLQFGLLYNFRYASSWGMPFDHPVLLFLFTLTGKIIIVGLIVVLLMALKKYLSVKFQFVIAWVLFALFASTLSNRPYPHYFLQLVPPVSLLIGMVLQKTVALIKKKQITAKFIPIAIGTLILILVFSVMKLLEVGYYPTQSYYLNSYQLMTGRMDSDSYQQSFNWLMEDNYMASNIIRKSGDKQMFIWGTNPMLYALSDTYPTGRFTVSFHIKDFDAYQETIDDLMAVNPTFIVTMKDETTPLPGLDNYLDLYYAPNKNFRNFVLWKKLNTD